MAAEHDVNATSSVKKELIRIGGMQCSFCVESIGRAFRRMDGVKETSVNLAHQEALVVYDPHKIDPSEFHKFLLDMGFSIKDPNRLQAMENELEMLKEEKRHLIGAASVGLTSLLLMILMWNGISNPLFPPIMFTLTLIMIFGVGYRILQMAIASLKRKILNQHVLMEFGAFGGLLGGLAGFFIQPWPSADFFGAAIFITLYHILSGYVSAVVQIRTSEAIFKLLALQPPTATVIRDEEEHLIPLEEIQVGDRVLVRPGERIPVDGVVVRGESFVDFSLVTGESLPRQCTAGDEVVGGALNQYGMLVVQTEKTGENTFLHQVARAIEEAKGLKPGVLQLVERVLKVFVPAVLIIAAASFLYWTAGTWLLFGQPNLQRAIYATLGVLVMGYPCALGMATPLAMIRGGGKAAEQGILMRAGEAFQVLKNTSVVCLDKTGTLTVGRPTVVSLQTFNNWTRERVLNLAASLEKTSEHPIAKAILDFAEIHGISPSLEVPRFKAISGRGILALVKDCEAVVGSSRFVREQGVDIPQSEAPDTGLTRAYVAFDGSLVGIFEMKDVLKEDAAATVQKLKERRIETILLTGDNREVAALIAEKTGIKEFHSELLPQQKAAFIRQLQKDGKRVAMVGDGINDAPALKQADVGIAYANGSDITIETADIVFINPPLQNILMAIDISNNSYRKTVQNVSLAFAFNGVGIPLAALALIHPVMAMAAMALSVSTILVNSYLKP